MENIVAKVKRFPAAKCIGALYKVAVTAGSSTKYYRKWFFSISKNILATKTTNAGSS